MRELTGWSKDLRVSADADDVVSMVVVMGWWRWRVAKGVGAATSR